MNRTESLLRRWSQFIGEVQLGYHLTIYDYTSELAVRDSLTRELSGASSDELTALDDSFRRATREAVRDLPGAPDASAWWWRRVPREAPGEFTAELKSEGL